MDSLAKEILDTVNGNAEHNNYDCDENDIGNAKMWLSFGLQRVIDINGQRITLALEPSIIYKADCVEDIWLFCYQGTDEIETLPPYKEYIYPVCIFKGSHKVWEDGKDEMYKMICNGRYDGKWVDLHEEHWDDETHNCIAEVNMHLNDWFYRYGGYINGEKKTPIKCNRSCKDCKYPCVNRGENLKPITYRGVKNKRLYIVWRVYRRGTLKTWFYWYG